MPFGPPYQTSPFPNNRRAVRQRDPEQRQSKHGLVGRPRGPPSADAPPIRVLRTPDAANYLGLTASTLEKMRLTGWPALRSPRLSRRRLQHRRARLLY